MVEMVVTLHPSALLFVGLRIFTKAILEKSLLFFV